jgi:hypothetical protein
VRSRRIEIDGTQPLLGLAVVLGAAGDLGRLDLGLHTTQLIEDGEGAAELVLQAVGPRHQQAERA